MRLFWFIYTFCLFAFSAFPCSDKEGYTYMDNRDQASLSQSNTTGQHSHQDDQCTPFCICNCCGKHISGSGIAFLQFNKKTVFTDKKNHRNIYDFIYSNEFTANIWQPPKLS